MKFLVKLPDTWAGAGHTSIPGEVVTINAFEMDVLDGALMFTGPNRTGYIAGFAPGMWNSVTST